MKQHIYLLPVVLLLTVSSMAQTTTQYALTSTGGHTTINGKHFEFSLGELFTVTGLGATVKNTPGILQPFVSPNAGRALPSSLVFSAQKKNHTVTLHWISTHDPEVLKFDIEYDNGKEWIKLGELFSKYTDSTSRYDFHHDSPKTGDNRYRLKLIKMNGNFSYSPVRNIMLEEPQTFTVFPNPASQYIYFSGISTEDIRQISLFDMSGKRILQTENVNSPQLDIRHLKTGTYIIRIIKKSGEEKTQKILIQK